MLERAKDAPLWARGSILPIGLIALAEAAWMLSSSHSDNIAPPHAIVSALVSQMLDGTLATATLQTLGGAIGGLVIGFGFGLLSGSALGLSRLLDRLTFVSVEVLRPIPSVAFIPIAMLVFGFGYRMEIAVVAFATFWPTLLLTRSAAANIEPRLIEVARALGFGLPAIFCKLIVPAAAPRIFIALRLSAGVALIVAVTVEVTANPIGLGYGVMNAQQSLQPASMFAQLCWLAILGWSLNYGLQVIEARLFRGADLSGAAR